MEALLYFALWAGVIFLMMRFGCGPQVMGQGRGAERTIGQPNAGQNAELRWVPPEKDVDPVCGKTVVTEQAKSSVYAGNVYYFCSRECREIFETAPDLYLGGDATDRPKLEHSHA